MNTPEVIEQDIQFNGNGIPTPFTKTVTKTAGSPDATMSNLGCVSLALDNTAEVQGVRLSFGDVLAYPALNLISLEWWAQISASLDSHVNIFMGVGNAGNNAPASITHRAGFLMTGGGNLTLDAVDGTNSQTGVATNLPMVSSGWQKFSINFKEGHITAGPPLSNVGGIGGLGNLIFRAENYPQNVLRQFGQRSQFSLAALVATDGLQPIFQIVKTSNAATGTLKIRRMRARYLL